MKGRDAPWLSPDCLTQFRIHKFTETRQDEIRFQITNQDFTADFYQSSENNKTYLQIKYFSNIDESSYLILTFSNSEDLIS